MISKNKISELRKLHSKKFRDEFQLFIVEGIKSVKMLLGSVYDVVDVYVTNNFLQENQSWLKDFSNITEVSRLDMERISTLQTPPEILAVCRQRSHSCQIPKDKPIIVLDGISDPGNFGTIVRTADWFGIKNIVCSTNSVEFYNPKTIQATMGSFLNVEVHKFDLVDFLTTQKSHRRILGTFMEGSNIDNFKFLDSDIIVIGNEANGISDDIAKLVTNRITICKNLQENVCAESLNASIAAAIVMFAWRK